MKDPFTLAIFVAIYAAMPNHACKQLNSGDSMAISWLFFDMFTAVIAERIRYVNTKHDSTMSAIVLLCYG